MFAQPLGPFGLRISFCTLVAETGKRRHKSRDLKNTLVYLCRYPQEEKQTSDKSTNGKHKTIKKATTDATQPPPCRIDGANSTTRLCTKLGALWQCG